MAAPNSLRKKSMAVNALPRRQSVHPNMQDGSFNNLPPPPRVRPKDKSKVESLMKRRYSSRGPLPVPSSSEPFPAELSVKNRNLNVVPEAKSNRREPLQFDNSSLKNPRFDPEQYIASSLSNATEDDVQAFYESLRELKKNTSVDLQSNVFNNYASFVSLSHEISSLTSDLSSLSSLLIQFSSLTQSLSSSVQKDESEDTPSGFQRERRGAQHNRNSVADLAQIHAVHLQELWHHVEGSQKFLPAHPGRHVIKESLHWTELNAATWKPTKSVHLILLNDHVLVAAKKRKARETRRSVADKCWHLADVEISELQDDVPGAIGGALQISRGREVAVYAPGEGRESERVSFIKAFKRANIDLYNKRKHTEANSGKVGPSVMVPMAEGHVRGNDAFLRRISLTTSMSDRVGFLDATAADGNALRRIQDHMDDLDVRIAMREFEEAVQGIEKGRQMLATMDSSAQSYSLLSLHLSHRTQQLINLLTHSLSFNSRNPTSTKRYSQLLIRVGEHDLARSTYLSSRAAYVKQKIRAIQHPGAYGASEVDSFVEAIAWIVVRIIKNTWGVYNEVLGDSKTSSNFFEWCKEQVEEFAEIFRRQLYGYPTDSELYLRSKDGVMEIWSELKKQGLDMTFLLEALIAEQSEENEKNGDVASLTKSVKGLGLDSM